MYIDKVVADYSDDGIKNVFQNMITTGNTEIAKIFYTALTKSPRKALTREIKKCNKAKVKNKAQSLGA